MVDLITAKDRLTPLERVMTDRVNPEILTIARESRERTQADVAKAIGVTQGLISKAEHGLIPPGPDEINAIAEFLDYPPELFYEPGRIREGASACLYHRKRKTLPARTLRSLNATMHLRNLNAGRLFDGLDVEGSRRFLSLDPDEFGGSPVEVARALRTAWRLPEEPIQNMTALIESAGGIVVMQDFGTRKLFGMSCWTTHNHPLFFLNSSIPTADLRWTLAHELGHLTMHHLLPDGDPEEQADAFAGELLAPEAVFRPMVRSLAFDRLVTLKSYWRLSMKGIIKRAQVLGAIDQATATRLYKQHSARGYNTAEPFPLTPEPPTLVQRAADVHLHEHGYSPDELATAVRLPLGEFYKDVLGWPEPNAHTNVVSLFARPASSPIAQ